MKLPRRAFLAAAAWPVLAAQDPAPEPKRVEADFPPGPLLPPERIEGPLAGQRWAIQYMFDEVDSELLINDFVTLSSQRAIAVGLIRHESRHDQGVALLTRDAGRSWTTVRLKDEPYSIFALDDSRLFLVGADALWYSNEGGASWERRKLPKTRGRRKMFRCLFRDEKRGWIFGLGKTFYSTTDGGLSWEPVAESVALDLKDANTLLAWGAFTSPKSALILGHSAGPRPDGSRFPDWMMPEHATRSKLLPSTTVFLQTIDEGKTWHATAASLFGSATRMRVQGSRALAIYDYGDGFPVPSEVYAMDLRDGASTAFFRRQNLTVTDALPLAGGGALLACIEMRGRLRNSPLPGKLHILLGTPAGAWHEMKVDYRATGVRAALGQAGENEFWVATSDGVILHLQPTGKP
jgi:hypothetical protein